MTIPLYKYLDTRGALATLQNQNFKWTKPSQFVAKYKDNTDMTLSRIFPQNSHDTVRNFKNVFVKTLLRSKLPLPNNYLQLIAVVLRENADVAQLVQCELENEHEANLFNFNEINFISEQVKTEVNKALQQCRVLCSSSDNLSNRMWENYADDEKGIVLQIRASSDKNKDSVFNLFKPIKYFETRPPLFDSPQDFLYSSLYEDQPSFILKTIEKIIYAKTLPYSYESEYRCIDIRPEKSLLVDLFQPFYPEEITALYLGRKSGQEHREKYIHLAKKINPNIAIFQMTQQSNGTLYAAPLL